MNSQMTTIITTIIGSQALFTFIIFLITHFSRQTKILKYLLKNAIYQMIDRQKARGGKSHQDDYDFDYMMRLYIGEGNGNSESMIEEWKSIPFYEDKK